MTHKVTRYEFPDLMQKQPAYEANRRIRWPSSISAAIEADKIETGILNQLKEKQFHD